MSISWAKEEVEGCSSGDLTSLEISDGCWHKKAQDRLRWKDTWSQCMCVRQDQQVSQANSVLCTFAREHLEGSATGLTTSVSHRDYCQCKNKLVQFKQRILREAPLQSPTHRHMDAHKHNTQQRKLLLLGHIYLTDWVTCTIPKYLPVPSKYQVSIHSW